MASNHYQDRDILKLEKTAFGIDSVAYHHIKKAKEACDRMRISVQADNASLVMYEAAQVAAAVQQAYDLLADDKSVLTENTKS